MNYRIFGINGPIVTVAGKTELLMGEVVRVGARSLVGEVIAVSEEKTVIQVYEETSGTAPGEEIRSTGQTMSLELGPGLIGNIYDGIGRPLTASDGSDGAFLSRGAESPSISGEKKYAFRMLVKPGDRVFPGMYFAECRETQTVLHRCMVP
ncbi:MAG: V-type ATP synthase subunit A, partial [Clostridia bacterium]|nr:V-type ATP synthase subunit A [Clostridia bacterium]